MINKWVQIATDWQKFTPAVKKKWSQLTDQELMEVKGSRNTLALMIQQRYFVTKKTAHDQIDGWVEGLKI